MHLEDNLFNLFNEIKNDRYKHSPYKYFEVFDNKKRDIHKAEIKDRVVYQIIHDYLLSFFELTFISDSYSSRIKKGQYKAINSLRYFIRLSFNNHKQGYALKGDIKKYFDSIDHNILLGIIREKISDDKIFKIIKKIRTHILTS